MTAASKITAIGVRPLYSPECVEGAFCELRLDGSRKFTGKVEPNDPPLCTNQSMCSVERIPNQSR
jgi:hypothetical protein